MEKKRQRKMRGTRDMWENKYCGKEKKRKRNQRFVKHDVGWGKEEMRNDRTRLITRKREGVTEWEGLQKVVRTCHRRKSNHGRGVNVHGC